MPERWVRDADAVSQSLDGETFVLPRGSAAALQLNGTASLIWALLTSPHSAEELTHAVATTYAVEIGQAEKDVGALLVELSMRGVLHQVQE
jgi:hypothetical protein